MTLGLVAALLFAASPDAGVESLPAPAAAAVASSPDGGVPSAPKKANYLKLAAPAFSGVNLDANVAGFISEHFANALVQRGVVVMTPSEINAMIGLERTKQLAGCADDASSCVAELSNALGVDGLVAGTVAKFGGIIQANIKVFSARDGSAMKVVAVKVGGEEQLLEALSAKAAEIGPELLSLTGRDKAPTAIPEPDQRRLNAITINPVAIVGTGNYGIEYARTITPWLVAFIQPVLVKRDNILGASLGRLNVANFNSDGSSIVIGARFYWPGPARGFFAAPQLEVGSGADALTFNDGTPDDTDQGTLLSLGAMVGHTWIIYDMIPLTIGIGGGYSFLDYRTGFVPNWRINAGYAF